MDTSATKPIPAKYDLTGRVFGKLTVLSFATINKRRGRVWLCVCLCGEKKNIAAGSLTSGLQISCGCWKKAKGSESKLYKHGLSYSRIYKRFKKIKSRCYDRNNTVYENYGGRGIKVCQRWLDSVEAFVADMGDPPSPKHQVERIDNDGDYSPENCRWATQKEQMCNTRRNVMVEYEGKTVRLVTLAARHGLSTQTVVARLQRGWDIETAITKPTGKMTKKHKHGVVDDDSNLPSV